MFMYEACALYRERTGGCASLSSVMHMSHLLLMYNRNDTCLESSLFSVLFERLVSVVVKCVVKDQQVLTLKERKFDFPS